MGSSSSKSIEQQLKIRDSDWEYLTIEHGQQVVKHRRLGWQGEVAVMTSDPLYSIEDELDIYNYRKSQEKALVEVYSAEYLKSTQATMCGNQQNIKVIYERLPLRFKDLPLLTVPQAIYVLSESLRGFRECYDKIGSFELNDRMIGVNTKGNVKVWLNENFASNHPASERPSLEITVSAAHRSSASKEEAFFVRNLIEIVRAKLEERKFPAEFQLLLKSASGFFETYSIIQKYCEQSKTWIPDRIISSSRKRETTAFESTIMVQNGQSNSHLHRAAERNTYVSYPFVENHTNLYTPNSKRNPILFRSTDHSLTSPHQMLNRPTAASQISPLIFPSVNSRGITYKPI